MNLEAYLGRLGVAAPAQPDLAALFELHAAHAERIAYETLDIHVGRPTPSLAPAASVDRVLRHRGGYCYQLNGAFSALLAGLGYDVVWHPAGVQGQPRPDPPGSAWANHLALTVHGLPSDDNPTGDWLVDVGLGDAMHEPLPLIAGVYQQGPYRLGLRPSEVDPGGWRLDHDPRGDFLGMDFAPRRATVEDFLVRHEELWNSPESGFVRVCSAQRRDAKGCDWLRGCVLGRVEDPSAEVAVDAEADAKADEQVVDTAVDWFTVLADVFDLPLTDVSTSERDALWARVHAAHEVWEAAQ